MTVTTPNRQQVSSKTLEKEQGAIPGAVTAVTAVTSAKSENNAIDIQTSPPKTARQQTQLVRTPNNS